MTTMSMLTMKEEKVFEHYLNLLEEIRMLIIDEMQPDDRCRFTRCSKKCSREAISSKKFVYELAISAPYDDYITINVSYCKKSIGENGNGYRLFFGKESNEKLLRCQRLGAYYREEFWTKRIDKATDLVELSAQYFKNKLQLHQNKIVKLTFNGWLFEERLRILDFGIQSLNHLEEFIVNTDTSVSQLLLKLRRPLKTLEYSGMEDISGFEQTYQVKDNLVAINLKLNKEQLSNLSASSIKLNIGELNVEDIADFMKSWQNGETRQNFKCCEWVLWDSEFETQQFLDRFGLDPPVGCTDECRGKRCARKCKFAKAFIKHHKQDKTIGCLSYYVPYQLITFQIIPRRNQ